MTVVYLQINDWNPYPKESKRLINDYLEGLINIEDESIGAQPLYDWIKENKLCINQDVYDQSLQYWITTTKEWLEENFPELLLFANEEPKDDCFKGDRKWFLRYCDENVGLFFINESSWGDELTEENLKRLVNLGE